MKFSLLLPLLLVSILLLPGPLPAQFPSIGELPFDKALEELDRILPVDSLKMKTLDASYLLLQKAYQNEDTYQQAKTHSFISSWNDYYNLFPADSIFYHETKALGYFQDLGEMREVAEALRNLSTTCLNQSQLEESQLNIFKALEIYLSLGDTIGEGKVYKNIAALYYVMEDYEQSKKYGELCVERLKGSEEYYTLSIVNMNLIPVYNALQEYPAALAAANEAIRIEKEHQLKQIGIILRTKSFRGDTYLAMEEFDKAEEDYRDTYDLVFKEVGDERGRSWEMDIGIVQYLKGEYKPALKRLLRSIEFYSEEEIPTAWVPYGYIADCYQALGDYENALLYSEKTRSARDSMYSAKIRQLRSEAMIKYESGKKDEAIAQRDERLRKQRQIQLLGFSLAGLFALMLLGLLYFFLRNRRINQQLSSLNFQLETSNQDKEILLKEIHHRVKNNLQTVSSLLYLQSAHIDDPSIKDAVAEGQHRVESMALIHQKLYQRDNLAAIEMQDYLGNLAESLFNTYGISQERISLQLDMEKMELDVDTAVPVGLIVNELLTNSLKYAFPEKASGEIRIGLSVSADNMLHLSVSDNGQGMLAGEKPKGTAFGSQLVQLLTTQLGGKLQTHSNGGYRTDFQFSKFQLLPG